ncbi:MAG TPA: response regulator [Syntrophorhabdaceae bacterium]
MTDGIKTLVCDDDPEVLLLMASVLSKAGYPVVKAATGRGCLETVYAERPGLVLLDVMLPDMRGDTVCRKIKSDHSLEGTFVILTSGIQVSSDNQAKGLQIGADGYIVKPVSNKELVARVQAMDRIKRAEDALREKEKQQEKLIADLQAALAEIKTLKGFIPICASCKKIRDDEGYWNQLEAYLSKHTDAIFSHGLCPDCADKLRDEVRQRMKNK